MARIIGVKPQNLSYAEEIVQDFLCKELPDYITVGFNIQINGYELDAVLFIPHMGIFILEIKGGGALSYRDGQFMIHSERQKMYAFNPLRTKRQRNQMIEYMRESFYINPLVYELNCFPLLNIDSNIRTHVKELEEHFLFKEDFANARTFLLKLFKFYTVSHLIHNSVHYDDIDDEMVYYITRHWGMQVEVIRPVAPPFVFLSYNGNNQGMAKNIQRELELNDIFTWKAPMDVSAGGDYIEEEINAIRECNAFVLLLSASAQESEEVKIEFEEAMKNNKKIFPILLGTFEINQYYRTALHRIEWRVIEDDDLSFLSEIVGIIKSQL